MDQLTVIPKTLLQDITKKFKEVFWRKDSSFLCKAEKVWPKSDFSSDCRNNADLNQEMREVLVAPV